MYELNAEKHKSREPIILSSAVVFDLWARNQATGSLGSSFNMMGFLGKTNPFLANSSGI